MTAKILVPMDDSAMAQKALTHALEVHSGAEITVMHVVGGASGMGGEATALALEDDIDEAARSKSAPVFETAREIASDHGVELATETRLGTPGNAIIEAAEEYDAVVIGAHSGSLADRLIAGDVAGQVSRKAPVPVTVVR